MTPLRVISYKNEFFYKTNTFSREIHTYSETDCLEIYGGFSIWKFNDKYIDLVMYKRVIERLETDLDGAKKFIDELRKKLKL